MGVLRSSHEATCPSIASRFSRGRNMSPTLSISSRILSYAALCALLLAACEPAATPSRADTVTFAASKGLGDFEFAMTGGGRPGQWSLVHDDATQALAQTGTDSPEDRFPVA